MLGIDIGAEVLEDEVAVRGIHAVFLQKAVVQGAEKLGIFAGVGSVDQLYQHLADLFVVVEDFHGIVAAVLLVIHDFVRRHTEDKGILPADFFYDLDVGTVHGSESHCAVEHELHVAGTGSFLTGRGNLLGNVGCRDDDLGVGYLVVLDEDNFDLVVNGLIVVDDICHRVDELDGQLGGLVSRGCLGAEDKGVLGNIQSGILFDLVVQVHHVQDIHQLTLVFVQTFDLHVKDGSGIHFDAVVLQDIVRKADLVLVLDVHELFPGLLVIHIDPEFPHAGQVSDPLVTDVVCDPVSEQGIGVKQETPLGDTVCLVVELVREHLVEVFQFAVLEDLGVESCDAVDAVAGDDRHIGHADLSVIDNTHAADLLVHVHAGVVIHPADLVLEAAVDLFHDLVDPGQQL